MAALGLIHLTKLHVVLSRVVLRSFMEAKKAFATVDLLRVWVEVKKLTAHAHEHEHGRKGQSSDVLINKHCVVLIYDASFTTHTASLWHRVL